MEPDALRRDVPLSELATLAVGGPARYYLEVRGPRRPARRAGLCVRAALPVLVLGGGSNVVVADEGFAGLVLHVRLRGARDRRAATGASS